MCSIGVDAKVEIETIVVHKYTYTGSHMQVGRGYAEEPSKVIRIFDQLSKTTGLPCLPALKHIASSRGPLELVNYELL